ncbi:MAG TPA: non-ribosomal peptide synthetase, partial [Longimicrobium sp.]|nr:non-ribosomal peptide synthetase [Longimicrobium sp.]
RETYSDEEVAVVPLVTSVSFDISIFEIFRPLASGGTVVVAENALAVPTLPERDRITLLNTVPSAAAELARMGAIPPSARTVNLAGEPLKRSLVDALYATGTVRAVWNLYGPSEDTTYSTAALVPRDTQRAPTIGRPLANTRMYVVDATFAPVPLGVAGELLVGGDGLARGYLGRPGMTAEKFVPDPFSAAPGARLYRTGDLVRFLPGGELDFLGRIDHQVKVRGFRIELGEIESVLLRHPAVRETVVVVKEDAAGDRQLVAYAAAGAGTDVGALRDHLRAAVPEYMVPPRIVVLDALPHLPNGKIDRKALPEPDLPAASEAYVEPATEAERAVAAAMAEVLGLPRVGAADSFFELGGHSLKATQVMARLRVSLGVDLPLRVLFEARTVAELAKRVEEARAGGEASAAPARRITAAARGKYRIRPEEAEPTVAPES